MPRLLAIAGTRGGGVDSATRLMIAQALATEATLLTCPKYRTSSAWSIKLAPSRAGCQFRGSRQPPACGVTPPGEPSLDLRDPGQGLVRGRQRQLDVGRGVRGRQVPAAGRDDAD